MIGWWLAIAWGADAPTDYVLEEGFPFCDEAGRGGPEVLALCPLLEGLPPDRCPGLRATCAAGVVPEPEAPGCNEMSGGPAESIAGAPEAPTPEVPDLDLPDLSEFAKSLVRWVTAILVAVLVLVLFRLAWATFARARRPKSTPATTRVVTLTEEPPLPDDLPAAPVADVLATARAALAAGRFDEVVVLARGAALKHLHEGGRVVLHRARTDREYVREVRRDRELGESLGLIARARESLLFGQLPVGAEVATAALRAAERIVLAALVLVCLRGQAAAADARYAPGGDAALPLVLRSWGHVVSWRLRPLVELDGDTDVLVLNSLTVELTPEQWLHLRDWVESGGVLWVAGEPPVGFDELGSTTVVDCMAEIDPLFAPLSTPRFAAETLAWTNAPQVVVWCGSEAAVQVMHLGDGVVVAFADDDLLLNGAFVDPATERFVGDLLTVARAVDGWPVEVPAQVELATFAAAQAPPQNSNPFRSIANSRLLPFVVQLLAAFGVLALWRGWAFAPLRDPEAQGRRSFSEHVRALGTHLARSRASGVAARSSARYWLGRMGVAGLVLSAERAGRSREAATTFARQVEARATGDGARTPSDHDFMEELWTITRGRTP